MHSFHSNQQQPPPLAGAVMTDLTYRLHAILAGAWRQRYLIVLPILILSLVGLIVGLSSPKRFSAHTSMLIQETAKMNPFLEDLAVSSMLKERMSALQTLLHSRHILSAVAEERGLLKKESEPIERDQVIDELSGALKVKMEGKDLIRIDYLSSTPEGMKETLESVSKHFVEQLLAPERSSMKDSTYFLSQQLQQRRKDLDKAETVLANFKNDHASALPELHAGNIARLAQLRQRLAEREAELAGMEKSLGGLDRQISQTNPVLGRLEEKIITLRGDLAMLRARYTDQHSEVKAALRNLGRLEDERRRLLTRGETGLEMQQLWDIASSAAVDKEKGKGETLLISQLGNLQLARSKVEGLHEESRRLKEMVTDLQQQTEDFGKHEQQLTRVQRDLNVKRALYEELLRRYEMARVTGSLGAFEQAKRVKVIDRPFTPSASSNPPLLLFIIGGALGGLFLGCGIATLLELCDTTIRRRKQLER